MKDNILILMVIALLYIGFFASGISYTGEAYRTAIVDRGPKFQDASTVGNREYLISIGKRFPYHTSPAATGISFLNKPEDGTGDVDRDGDIDKNDLRIVIAMYSRTLDIPFYSGGERFNLGKEYQGGETLGYTKSSIGYYLPGGDIDKDGIITRKDIYWIYYLVNPTLGMEIVYDNLILEASCTESGKTRCFNYPGDDKVFKKGKVEHKRGFIGICREMLPDSGVVGLYAYDIQACPVGTECVPVYDVVADKFGHRDEKISAECKARIHRQMPTL